MIQKLQYNIYKTISPISKKFINGNYKSINKEIRKENITIIGKIPNEINGVYVRNGPNSINKKINHWFDGDGMIHSLYLNGKNNISHYQNIFVKTKLLHENFSPFTLGSLYGLQGFFILILELLKFNLNFNNYGSTANTSVIWHNNYLLALNDNDLPHILELNYKGIIKNSYKLNIPLKSITSHPKKDFNTNELFFISYDLFKTPYLQVGCMDKFNIKWLENINISPVMMHDFAITENYIIILDLSLTLNLFNMIKGGSIIKFDNNKKSRIGILKKKSKQTNIQWFNLPNSFACFHTINAFEKNNCINLYICQYNNINIEFINNYSKIYKYNLDIDNNTITSECLNELNLEFPCINSNYIGIKNRYCWISHINTYTNIDAIIKIDLESKSIIGHIKFPNNYFGGETIFVSNGKEKEDEGFLLIYLYNELTNNTYLYIYNALTMNNNPLTIIILPQRIPYGLHGNFITHNELINQNQS